MTLRPRYLAGLLAIGLALTACSSSSSGTPPAVVTSQATTTSPPPTTFSSSPVTTPSTPPVSAPATGTAPSSDALKAIVVQQSDVPSGYAGQAADTTSSDDDATEAQIVSCVGATGVNPADKVDEQHSDDFVKDPLTISSDATSYASQAAADAVVSVVQNPKAQSCFQTLLQQQVAASGGSVQSANITITPGAPSGAPSNVVALLTGSITVTAQGQQATINVWEAFIKGRQVLATVSGEALGAQVDTSVVQQVAGAVAQRAAAA